MEVTYDASSKWDGGLTLPHSSEFICIYVEVLQRHLQPSSSFDGSQKVPKTIFSLILPRKFGMYYNTFTPTRPSWKENHKLYSFQTSHNSCILQIGMNLFFNKNMVVISLCRHNHQNAFNLCYIKA